MHSSEKKTQLAIAVFHEKETNLSADTKKCFDYIKEARKKRESYLL